VRAASAWLGGAKRAASLALNLSYVHTGCTRFAWVSQWAAGAASLDIRPLQGQPRGALRAAQRGAGGAHPPGAPGAEEYTLADYVATFKELTSLATGNSNRDLNFF